MYKSIDLSLINRYFYVKMSQRHKIQTVVMKMKERVGEEKWLDLDREFESGTCL